MWLWRQYRKDFSLYAWAEKAKTNNKQDTEKRFDPLIAYLDFSDYAKKLSLEARERYQDTPPDSCWEVDRTVCLFFLLRSNLEKAD